MSDSMGQRVVCQNHLPNWATLPPRPEDVVRCTLGQAASIVVRHVEAVSAFYDDPITREYGMGNEMGPGLDRRERRLAIIELNTAGWTVEAFDAALIERTSPRWAYFSGLSAWLHADDEGWDTP